MGKSILNKTFNVDGEQIITCNYPYRQEMVNGRLACVSPDNASVIDMQTGQPMKSAQNNNWGGDPVYPYNYPYMGYPQIVVSPPAGGHHHHPHRPRTRLLMVTRLKTKKKTKHKK